jgi:hypothetical protein
MKESDIIYEWDLTGSSSDSATATMCNALSWAVCIT